MSNSKSYSSRPVWLMLGVSLIGIACIALLNENSNASRLVLQRYLQVLPNISLEMVKAQSALAASDGQVLAPKQIDMLEESLAKLLASQSSSFDKRNFAMKIEIWRRNNLPSQFIERELHRFGFESCEPNIQLENQIRLVKPVGALQGSAFPHYQVTLCYQQKDGSLLTASASSLDESPDDALGQ